MSLRATLHQIQPLHYCDPQDEHDLPSHVRAGSAIRRWNGYRVIVQDDVNALALLDEATGNIFPVLLPPGSDGRRTFGDELKNKRHKMDLEASVALPDGRLIAFGSGSTPIREHLVVLSPNLDVQVIHAPELYAALHSNKDFSGSELNIEGAVIVENRLRFFQRGNGAPIEDLQPVDATGDMLFDDFLKWLEGGPVPALRDVRSFDLGQVNGVNFGFTDAAVLPDSRVAFISCAEDSPDTYQDGEILGCRFGIIGDDIQLVDIFDAAGDACDLKLEGIDFLRPLADGFEFVVVADMDDPHTPATMAKLRVETGAR